MLPAERVAAVISVKVSVETGGVVKLTPTLAPLSSVALPLTLN